MLVALAVWARIATDVEPIVLDNKQNLRDSTGPEWFKPSSKPSTVASRVLCKRLRGLECNPSISSKGEQQKKVLVASNPGIEPGSSA